MEMMSLCLFVVQKHDRYRCMSTLYNALASDCFSFFANIELDSRSEKLPQKRLQTLRKLWWNATCLPMATINLNILISVSWISLGCTIVVNVYVQSSAVSGNLNGLHFSRRSSKHKQTKLPVGDLREVLATIPPVFDLHFKIFSNTNHPELFLWRGWYSIPRFYLPTHQAKSQTAFQYLRLPYSTPHYSKRTQWSPCVLLPPSKEQGKVARPFWWCTFLGPKSPSSCVCIP